MNVIPLDTFRDRLAELLPEILESPELMGEIPPVYRGILNAYLPRIRRSLENLSDCDIEYVRNQLIALLLLDPPIAGELRPAQGEPNASDRKDGKREELFVEETGNICQPSLGL